MPHMYCEMQNKLSNTKGSPLGSMGEIISSRCPIFGHTFANNGNQDETAPYEPSHQDFHCLLS